MILESYNVFRSSSSSVIELRTKYKLFILKPQRFWYITNVLSLSFDNKGNHVKLKREQNWVDYCGLVSVWR